MESIQKVVQIEKNQKSQAQVLRELTENMQKSLDLSIAINSKMDKLDDRIDGIDKSLCEVRETFNSMVGDR